MNKKGPIITCDQCHESKYNCDYCSQKRCNMCTVDIGRGIYVHGQCQYSKDDYFQQRIFPDKVCAICSVTENSWDDLRQCSTCEMVAHKQCSYRSIGTHTWTCKSCLTQGDSSESSDW